MNPGQKQTLVQQQRLAMSPQLIQSIKLMSLPLSELRDRIMEEVERNPALEVVDDPAIVPSGSPSSEAEAERADRGDFDSREWCETASDSGFAVSATASAASDEHQRFIDGALKRPETLQEHLLAQLSLCSLDQPVRSLAELVAQNLDHDGFHLSPPAELPGGSDPELLARALAAVRQLEPAGCACSGFQESLAVQARLYRADAPKSHAFVIDRSIEVIERHFDALEKGRPDALVRALAKAKASFVPTIEEAEDIIEFIRSLEPFPGRGFDSAEPAYVVPDVIVRREEDGFTVSVNGEELPVLGLSPFFAELEATGESADPARDFARESLREARWFMHTLSRRNLTILKVARAIVEYQRDFFLKGPAFLAPLRLRDIAEETGMHEATISRAAGGKYLQCEWGLFEIKYFFSGRVGSSQEGKAASPFSKQGVKERIKQIVEESAEPLSDQKIADRLALVGIKIARRTVAKYRSELTIGTSFDRGS